MLTQSNFEERSPFKTYWAYASVPDAYPEQTGQEMMRTLSMGQELMLKGEAFHFGYYFEVFSSKILS